MAGRSRGMQLALAVLLGMAALVVLPAFTTDQSRIDFEIAVYYPARAFLDGLDPYDQGPYLARYPVQAPFPPFLPASLLLHAPFALLPLTLSATVYLAVSVALVLVSAWLSLSFTDRPIRPAGVITVAALALLSRPGRLALRLGQLSFEPICGTYAALRFATSAPWLGGLGLFLASIKPTFGVPLAVLMLARRQVRSLAIGVALIVIVNAAISGILIRRAGGVSPFRAHLAATFDASRQGIVETSNPVMTGLRTDAASLVGRLRGHPLPSWAQAVVALAVLAVTAAILVSVDRSGVGRGAGFVAGFVCVAILLSGYHQVYDLSLLMLPAVVVARSSAREARVHHSAWGALRALLLLLGLNYVSSEGALSRFGLERETTGWLLLTSINAVLLLSAYIVFAASLIQSVRTETAASRQPRPGEPP